MSRPEFEVLHADQKQEWQELLARSHQHDFYHLPCYHALAERNGEGEARLFVYRCEPYVIGLPLLLRPIERVAGLQRIGAGWMDATSVYGYAGPVASHPEMPAAVLDGFHVGLRQVLEKLRVVAVFSRLHPFLAQTPLLAGLGDCVPAGNTVSVDLTLSRDLRRRQYRRDHRKGVARLEKLGLCCLHDAAKVYLDDFISIYHQTMRRVDADGYYFFRRRYLEELASLPDVHLFVALLGGRVVCGSLSTACQGILQHHLAGNAEEHLPLSPLKGLFDFTCEWGREHGCRVCHFGGGVGGREDPVFYFKAGFSDRRHEFASWRWVVAPAPYQLFCAAAGLRHGQLADSDFFPPYRRPTVSQPPCELSRRQDALAAHTAS